MKTAWRAAPLNPADTLGRVESVPLNDRAFLLRAACCLLIAACGDPAALSVTSLGDRGASDGASADGGDVGSDGPPLTDRGRPDTGLDGPIADTSDAIPDFDPTECTDVCFSWAPPRDAPAPTPAGAPIVYDACGAVTALPGSCPAGYSCGTSATVFVADQSITTPLCQGGTTRIDVDLPVPLQPSAPVSVTLRFFLNGLPWPTSVTGLGAGALRLVPRGGDRFLDVSIPTGPPGEVTVGLDPGIYDVYSQTAFGQLDNAVYPISQREGGLVVIEAGSADVRFESSRMDYDVTIDGLPLSPIAGEVVSVSFRGQSGQTLLHSYLPGEAVQGSAVLEPGRYEVTFTSLAPLGSANLPPGTVVLDPGLEVSGIAVDRTWDLTTTTVTGTITVDGVDLPAGDGGSVRLTAEGITAAEMAIGSARPATFTGRVFNGAYAVTYDAVDSGMAGIPSGTALAQASYTTGVPLTLALTTTEVSGTVLLNGGQIPDAAAPRGFMEFTSDTGSGRFQLPAAGAATYSGRLFNGVYDVAVTGTAETLPSVTWPFETGWVADATWRPWDLRAFPVTVSMTLGGVDPPDAAAGNRGIVRFDNEAPPGGGRVSASAPWTLTGPMTAAVVLPVGRWIVRHTHVAPEYSALPVGDVALGELVVSAEVSQAYEPRVIELFGALTRGGNPLAPAAAGLDRGALRIDTRFAPGAVQRIPGTEAASYSARVYPGIQHFWYQCAAADGCDETEIGERSEWVYYGVEVLSE